MSWLNRQPDPMSMLTARQREVLGLIAQGLSNRAIAELLGVSEKAVVRHTSNIYDCLGVPSSAHDHRRVHAVRHYLEAQAQLDATGEVASA